MSFMQCCKITKKSHFSNISSKSKAAETPRHIAYLSKVGAKLHNSSNFSEESETIKKAVGL